MSRYLIREDSLTALADIIRSKTGRSDTLTLEEMKEAISSIASTTEMENATAAAADVLEGKTFYAGTGGLKTGAMNAASLGITASKIVSGNTIMGVVGTGQTAYTETALSLGSLNYGSPYYATGGKVSGAPAWISTNAISLPSGTKRLKITYGSSYYYGDAWNHFYNSGGGIIKTWMDKGVSNGTVRYIEVPEGATSVAFSFANDNTGGYSVKAMVPK